MGLGYRIDVFNNTGRTLNIAAEQMQNISVCGIPNMQLAPGAWAGVTNNPPNQPYYVELTGETAVVTLAVEVVNFGSGSFTIQFDADSLQNYPGSAFFALPGGLQPIHVSEGPATGWIYASIYLTIFGEWTGVLVVLTEATGASGTIQPPYQIG
jgi:hypothetical protein